MKAEIIFCLLPVTLMAGFYCAYCVLWYVTGVLWSAPIYAHAAPFFTFLGLYILFCGWKVSLIFLDHGRAGIASINKKLMATVWIGAILTTIGLLILLLLILGIKLPTNLTIFYVNALAFPALLPFIHIIIERMKYADKTG